MQTNSCSLFPNTGLREANKFRFQIQSRIMLNNNNNIINNNKNNNNNNKISGEEFVSKTEINYK